MDLEQKIKFLIKNNLKWETNVEIPIEITENLEKGNIAQIEIYKKVPYEFYIMINDLNSGKMFKARTMPKVIKISPKIVEDKEIDQILLHELNHWYTEELYGDKIQPHGKEFKKCAKIIGLQDKFCSASPKVEGTKVHVLRCSSCNKIVAIGKTKKEVIEKSKKFLSACCSAKLKYDGVYII